MTTAEWVKLRDRLATESDILRQRIEQLEQGLRDVQGWAGLDDPNYYVEATEGHILTKRVIALLNPPSEGEK